MRTGKELVEEARAWLDVPFQFRGKTKAGCDCVGLIQGCCEALKIKFPEVPLYSDAPTGYEVYEWAETYLVEKSWNSRKPGDIILMMWPVFPVHFAIYSGNETLLHGINNGNRMPEAPGKIKCVVETPISPRMERRLYATFTIPSLEG